MLDPAMFGAAPQGPQDQPEGEDLLRQMLDLASQYREVEPDDEDKLAIERVSTLIQQLLAKNQKEADQMLGGQMNPRALRKAVGG